MRRLLVLRPEPGASATVSRARLRGLDAIAIPLFKVEPVDWQAPDPSEFEALLLSSATAVRFGKGQLEVLRALPVYAVGQASAQAAREAGFEVAGIGDGGIDQLLASIGPRLRLLHLCGEDRTSTEGAGQRIAPLVVYRARPLAEVDLRGAASSVALIHSPRAGERFASLVDRASIDKAAIAIAAISPAAAAAVGAGWGVVESAESPDDDALLALAERLCNKPGGQ